MSDPYAWVPWFKELAQKVADGEPDVLARRSEKIPWNAGGALGASALSGLGQEVDPFSFLYFLGSKGWDRKSLARVHPAITELFELRTKGAVYPEHGFYYPGSARNALFHKAGDGNLDLLWRLFRAAVSGPERVAADDFDRARAIFDVGIAKLTQALFLVNPDEFLPCDGESAFAICTNNTTVKDWAVYRSESEVVLKEFPRLSPIRDQHCLIHAHEGAER